MESNKKKIIAVVILVLIIFGSFFGISKPMSSPETYKETILSLDEKETKLMEMTAISAGAATALAAIPGDSTTPVANKLVDLSGYLLVLMTVVLLEKFLVTLLPILTFKLLIPLGCILLIVYLHQDRVFLRNFAIRIILFGIAIVCVMPISVGLSNQIESTYEASAQYSLEEAKGDLEEIEKSTANENIIKRMSSKLGGMIDLGETMFKNFIEGIAVMMALSIGIPILILFTFLWLIKGFWGINIAIPKPAKKPHELIGRKNKEQDLIE